MVARVGSPIAHGGNRAKPSPATRPGPSSDQVVVGVIEIAVGAVVAYAAFELTFLDLAVAAAGAVAGPESGGLGFAVALAALADGVEGATGLALGAGLVVDGIDRITGNPTISRSLARWTHTPDWLAAI